MHRKLQGLSQEALAEQVGVLPETISNIERAQHPPSLATLERLMDALGVTPSEFFDASADRDHGA
jgi:transcriptional regulator with XRE-family HTH domain